MRKVIFSFVSLALVASFFVTPIFAEEPSEDSLMSDEFESVRERLEKKREEIREQERLRQLELDQKREEANARVQTAREEFEERLQLIKSERKRNAVTQIDQNLVNINNRWTERFTKTLERLSELLVKVDSRADKLSFEGKDVTEVKSLIQDAQEAIKEAQVAVDAQALNEYTIDIQDEERLGSQVQEVVSQIKTDLKSVRAKVQKAKDAVHSAFVALKEVS